MKVLILILIALFVYANDYAVVAYKEVISVSKKELKAIFLKKQRYIDGKVAVPVNLSINDSVRASFEKNILNMSFLKLKEHWTKQHYLGTRVPISLQSQKSVLTFIEKIEGAIGYVDLNSTDKNSNIIYVWSD